MIIVLTFMFDEPNYSTKWIANRAVYALLVSISRL